MLSESKCDFPERNFSRIKNNQIYSKIQIIVACEETFAKVGSPRNLKQGGDYE